MGPSSPPGYGRYVELVGIAESVLKLCNVKPGDKLIINTDTRRNKNIVDAFFAASLALEADAILTISPPMMKPYERRPELIVETMKRADLTVELLSQRALHSPSTKEIITAGSRILFCGAQEDDIIRLRPNREIYSKCERGAELLDKTKTIRITSKAGTDLVMNKEGRGAHAQVGYVTKPRWENFPSALISTCPIEESVNGTLVLSPGTKLIKQNFTLSEKIRCEVTDGKLTEIEGGGIERMRIKDWFGSWNDPNVYVFAHIAIGFDPRASFESPTPVELESCEGAICCAFGSNWTIGGKNKASSHEDFIIREASIYVDDETWVKDGNLVHSCFE